MHCMKHFHEKMTIYERETSVNLIIITKSYYTDISWRGLLHVLVFICFFYHFKIINTGQIQKIVYSVGVVFKMHLIIYWWWVKFLGGFQIRFCNPVYHHYSEPDLKRFSLNKCSHFWIIVQQHVSVISFSASFRCDLLWLIYFKQQNLEVFSFCISSEHSQTLWTLYDDWRYFYLLDRKTLVH